MFTYDIQDGEAIIYHLIDDSIKSINIPRFIGGYPVCYVLTNIFLNITSLEYINGVKLKQGVNVIDNRYLFINYNLASYGNKYIFCVDRILSKILFSIDDDYTHNYCGSVRYIIDGLEYNTNFSERFRK